MFHSKERMKVSYQKVYTASLFGQPAIIPCQSLICLFAGLFINFFIHAKVTKGVIRADYHDNLIISLIRVWIDEKQTASGLFELQCMHC